LISQDKVLTRIASTVPRRSRKGSAARQDRENRTYGQEHARFQLYRKFIEYYNYERRHMVLNFKTSAEVYFKGVPNVLG
jgi:hypothetical protein